MVETATRAAVELLRSLDTTVEYLNSVRAVEWAEHLARIREHVDREPRSGVSELHAILPQFAGLYLSGARYGHNVSERQEIGANAKLDAMRDNLRDLVATLVATLQQSVAK